jgi:hypothetical protein
MGIFCNVGHEEYTYFPMWITKWGLLRKEAKRGGAGLAKA